jgi:mannose-6-phosphate isomerase-like protein (cupin superfamily)
LANSSDSFLIYKHYKFDKEEVFEVGQDDIFFVGKGTELLWENVGSEPWVYMIVAIPAAAKDYSNSSTPKKA